MPYKPAHILTHTEVKSILQEAWDLQNPMPYIQDVSNFKIKDFEVLENILTDFFLKTGQFSIEVPSAGALLKLLQNGDTKRNKAIASVSFYVLLKRDLLTKEEKNKLSTDIYGKNVFSDYTNRVKVLTKIKEYVSQRAKNVLADAPPTNQKAGRLLSPKMWVIIALSLITVSLVLATEKFWLSRTIKESDVKWEVINKENTNNNDTRVTIAYDLSDIEYSKAVLDFGDGQFLKLTKKKGIVSHTYGKTPIKMIALTIDDESFVKPLMPPSKGWEAYVGYNKLQESSFLQKGYIHLIETPETKPILSKKEFYIMYQKTYNFDLEMDDLVFETKLKNPESEGGISCFDVSIDLSGMHKDSITAISFNLLKPGCTRWAKLNIGEVTLYSENYDMTPSGQVLDEWKIVKGRVSNKTLEVFIDDRLIYKIPYKKPLGKLKQLQVLFKGNGTIDYFKISSKDGKFLYHDEFESTAQ